MSKSVFRVLLKSGAPALLLRNEKGHRLFYDEDGTLVANVGDDFEIQEELGSVETEAELTELTGLRPTAFLVTCPFCNRESLAMRTRTGWQCVRCDNFVPEEASSSEYIN